MQAKGAVRSKVMSLSRYLLPRTACVRGGQIEAYERAFAQATGSRHALGFWKGRIAFYAALKALGIGQDDEVLMPGYTCMVVPAAVMLLGARPVYADIEPEYATLDPDKVEAAITPHTKAIMIQHTYGWPNAGIEGIMDVARRHGLAMLEDCCHALGTRYRGRHAGNFGIAGFFSSQWSKPFTTGLGGMLVCNDPAFYERVRDIREEEALWPQATTAAQLAAQGVVYELLVYPTTMALARNTYRWLTRRRVLTGSTASNEYTGASDDYFQRMCAVQATAGLCELKRLDRVLEHRRQIAEIYTSELRTAGWPMPRWPDDADVTLLRYPVRVMDKEAVLRTAERHLFELGDWFVRPLHSHLAPQEPFGYAEGMCPEAEKAAREFVNLPTHLRVTPKSANRVIAFLLSHAKPAEETT